MRTEGVIWTKYFDADGADEEDGAEGEEEKKINTKDTKGRRHKGKTGTGTAKGRPYQSPFFVYEESFKELFVGGDSAAVPAFYWF